MSLDVLFLCWWLKAQVRVCLDRYLDNQRQRNGMKSNMLDLFYDSSVLSLITSLKKIIMSSWIFLTSLVWFSILCKSSSREAILFPRSCASSSDAFSFSRLPYVQCKWYHIQWVQNRQGQQRHRLKDIHSTCKQRYASYLLWLRML